MFESSCNCSFLVTKNNSRAESSRRGAVLGPHRCAVSSMRVWGAYDMVLLLCTSATAPCALAHAAVLLFMCATARVCCACDVVWCTYQGAY